MALIEPLEARALLAVTGLTGTYYDDANFGGKSITRTDRAIDFNWAKGKPDAKIGADTFSVRWTGRVKAPTSESYRLMLTSESAVRLWVGDQLLIDGWKSSSKPVTFKGTINLTAGKRYDLEIELLHNTGNASVKFVWQTDTLAKQTVPSKLLTPVNASLQAKINHAVLFARDQISRTLKDYPTPSKGFPDQTKADGTWQLAKATDWTSGYFGGQLWQLNTYFPNAGWSAKATTWTTPLSTQSSQTGDHFSRLWNTFKPLLDSGNPAARQVLIEAANSKDAQFNDRIGAFKTPELLSNSGNLQADFGLLMDQTMDLDLMFWASEQTGDTRYRDHAIKHLETVIARMVRSDGSVFQRFFFNTTTGNPIGGENYQGFTNKSTWSRGQAWAVYSFSRIAELTNRPDFIAAARKVADYFVSHLPSDFVPYWDFQAPNIPNAERDTSAAAIAARGLIRLSKLTGDPTYNSAAANILGSLLSSKYLAEGTASRGILQHAALNVPKHKGADVSLVFADYYLLEAINAYTNRT